MKSERRISAYKSYFIDFIHSIDREDARKIYYILDMLKTQDRLSVKFVKYIRDGLYELRAERKGNIFRVFFIVDGGKSGISFNGFHTDRQKNSLVGIGKAIIINEEYYEDR